MENNNTFKTIPWIIVVLAIVVLAIVLLTKNRSADNSDENMVIGEADVETIDILKLESFPVQINVIASGNLPDGCTELGDVEQNYANGKFDITLETRRPLDEACTQTLVPFEKTFALSGVNGLPKGTYAVEVNGITGAFTLEMDNFISETDPLK